MCVCASRIDGTGACRSHHAAGMISRSARDAAPALLVLFATVGRLGTERCGAPPRMHELARPCVQTFVPWDRLPSAAQSGRRAVHVMCAGVRPARPDGARVWREGQGLFPGRCFTRSGASCVRLLALLSDLLRPLRAALPHWVRRESCWACSRRSATRHCRSSSSRTPFFEPPHVAPSSANAPPAHAATRAPMAWHERTRCSASRRSPAAACALLLACVTCRCGAGAAPEPKLLGYKVVADYPHDKHSFTQGVRS